MKKLVVLMFGVLTSMLLSCSKEQEIQNVSCESVACTMELRWISVKVVDKTGDPVALSRMKVTRVSNGQDLTREFNDHEWGMMRSAGSYPIASDLDDKRFPRHQHIRLRFQGYVGAKEVVYAEYVVAFDCCHIGLVSGDRELVAR